MSSNFNISILLLNANLIADKLLEKAQAHRLLRFAPNVLADVAYSNNRHYIKQLLDKFLCFLSLKII